MKKYILKRNIYFTLAIVFYVVTLVLIIKNYPTVYYIPIGIITSYFIYNTRKMNKQLKNKEKVI
jgi:hypothetical protein